MKRFDDQKFSDWVFHLGSDKGSKSKILKFKNRKLYDFQHPKEYFDDFKQNLVLRILDGRIQIFHDLKGNEYFPSEYVTDDTIKKANAKKLTVQSFYNDSSAHDWTIQRVGINSGCILASVFIALSGSALNLFGYSKLVQHYIYIS